MKKYLNLGVVGCGEMSQSFATLCKLNRYMKIKSCADINSTCAQQFAKKYSIKHWYTDYLSMIQNNELDAIYLSVPHYLHYPILSKAIEVNLHALCEKPITTDINHAIDLCKKSKSKNVKIAVNYQYRYDSSCYQLVMSAHNNILGDLYYCRCNVPWHRTQDYFDSSPWRGRISEAGGGTLLTHASHVLDIALWAFGKQPSFALGTISQKKFKNIDVEDTAMGIVEMEDASLINITSSIASTPEQKVSIELYGSKGTALYTGPDYPPFSHIRFKGVKAKRYKLPIKGLFSYQRSLEAFRQWILYDVPYLCPIEASLPVLSAITAIYHSSQSGRKILIDKQFE